jgi:hypothetical protein
MEARLLFDFLVDLMIGATIDMDSLVTFDTDKNMMIILRKNRIDILLFIIDFTSD